MNKDRDLELTARAGEVDDIAAQEAIDDERAKQQNAHNGGTLERYINLVSTVNFSFVLQCSWEAAAVTFQFALSNGGPASIVYGSILAGFGTTLVVVSLAEMASMDPTVGAQYRWSATFAPKWPRFFGLMQGWITVFAWICSCTSNPALISNIITGLVIFNNPDYVPKQWHTTLLMWAITSLPFFANFYFRKLLNPFEAIGALLHVIFFIVSIITLVVLAPRSSPDYVFKTLTHDSGWEQPVVAFGIGLLTVAYPLTGFDGVMHMSDEVKKTRIRVPRSMIFSVVLNGIMQFAFMTTVLFTIGDPAVVAADPLPIIQVYYQATGSKPATNLFVIVICIIIFVSFFNVFASVSRLIWAFSRDNGLPFSKTFAKVHPTLKMPLNALILLGACLCILAIINVGSTTAFNAFISLPALGGYISYFIPILFIFIRRLSTKHPTPIPWGPFRLGRVGPFINFAAMVYILFVLCWLPLPSFRPVDRETMNYAGPIAGFVILFAIGDWCVSGRKRFKVPVLRRAEFE
ncbi:hypothetical protein DPSP01_007005 [Paraphaeosphaeria sporulosa]|uniref:Amino acid transporter n=1 Tax=Paraphaeosphaeria sporulosa TaxID=1460663 RepID=A0A177CIJ4_9PLEO|nr:amino acid transporter [Paraphaeosphaeria sporulosa]OAG06669.1 amino acid transporter [Paraphaeosphaeria sporulosa]